VKLATANIQTATTRWVKARVELGDDRATIFDVKHGRELAVLHGVPQPLGTDRWRVGDAIVVATKPGCLCGGTVVQDLTKPERQQRTFRRREPARSVRVP
jgi:hypothetical protein